jgi:ABC-type transport system involved in cytochrome bd biosynthesis fused ATPase/permease subunit
MTDDGKSPESGNGAGRLALRLTRTWLPAVVAIVGLVAVIIGHGRTGTAAAGVVLMGAALIVWMINWLFRMSLESNRDRDREEEARVYFDRTGRWPDDPE